jgi:cytochrome c oxidase subunit 1
MGAFMGMAGLRGMLRRSIYENGEYNVFMILAGLCGAMLLAAFLAFLVNILRSVGVSGALSLFRRIRYDDRRLLPA